MLRLRRRSAAGAGPVLVQEVEDERRRPGELLAALSPAGHGTVVLVEAKTSRQLDERAANLGGEARVPIAIETALENPVENRPDRAAPVSQGLETGICRRQARHGPAGVAHGDPGLR